MLGLDQLISDAERHAILQTSETSPSLILRWENFSAALEKRIIKKNTKSQVNLSDVGGLEEAKELLKEALGQLVIQKKNN